MPNDPKTGAVDGVKYFNVGWTDLDHPIVNVTWDDCRKFCAWASEVSEIALDLPSEAQWEYACRGGKAGQEFQWGGATDDVSVRNFLTANVWCSDNKIGDRGGTGSVNRTSRVWRNHPWLLVDMVGNVWEWCLDYYDSEWYSRAHASGIDIVNRTSAPARKRTLPDGTTMESPIRCFRGGSWNINDPVWFRSSTRSGDFPNRKNSLIGFRLAAGPG
jgi:formylglycine-generating enzyme required for sulfatase activity